MIKKPYKKYINKYCLYKKILEHDYTRIFVIGIKDNIIKYHLDYGKIEYSDISKFDNCTFIVSPLDNTKDLNKEEDPNIIQIGKVL